MPSHGNSHPLSLARRLCRHVRVLVPHVEGVHLHEDGQRRQRPAAAVPAVHGVHLGRLRRRRCSDVAGPPHRHGGRRHRYVELWQVDDVLV